MCGCLVRKVVPDSDDPQMADEDDLQLQEALRRSLQQTNIQESQLADALAESVRTHDHEIARNIQLCDLERDLIAQTTTNPNETLLPLEAQVLSHHSTVEPEERDGQVVGDPSVKLPRYIPLNLEIAPSSNPNTFADVNITSSTSEHPSHPFESSCHAYDDHASRLKSKIPYRPPNLHRSDSSNPSSKSANYHETRSESISISAIPQHRTSPAHQATIRPLVESSSPNNEPLVVIDGQNVGCSYGAGGVSRFRAKGVEVVLDFYFNRGIPAVAMLPRNKVDTRPSIPNDRVADDPDLLNKLEDQGRLAFTPAGAHDDHFLLSYAMKKGIDIISNDRFQKEVSEQETLADARRLREFLNDHLIPYTFVHGEFCPNPNQSQLGRSIHHSRTRT